MRARDRVVARTHAFRTAREGTSKKPGLQERISKCVRPMEAVAPPSPMFSFLFMTLTYTDAGIAIDPTARCDDFTISPQTSSTSSTASSRVRKHAAVQQTCLEGHASRASCSSRIQETPQPMIFYWRTTSEFMPLWMSVCTA